MAKQRFLQGTFIGSIGGVTATRTKGQNIIKQKKWAKCHNGELSNNSYYSFVNLHRLCCKVAPALKDTLLKTVKKQDLIPRLETEWKAWIKEHTFPVDGILKVAEQTLPITLNNIAYNEFTFTTTFEINNTVLLPPQETAFMFFFIHNQVGEVFATHFFPYSDNQITIQLAGVVEHQLYLSGGIIHNKPQKTIFTSPFHQNIYIWQP